MTTIARIIGRENIQLLCYSVFIIADSVSGKCELSEDFSVETIESLYDKITVTMGRFKDVQPRHEVVLQNLVAFGGVIAIAVCFYLVLDAESGRGKPNIPPSQRHAVVTDSHPTPDFKTLISQLLRE